MKARRLVMVMVVAVGAFSSAAMALPPMGPPTATLKAGQLGVGFEYGYSDMDLEADATWRQVVDGTPSDFEKSSAEVDGMTSNWLFGKIGYGVMDNWEAYVRLGAADADGDLKFPDADRVGFSNDYGFAWGFGTRYTFLEHGNLSWGALFQMTWANPDDDDLSYTTDIVGDGEVPVSVSGDIELDWWEIQVAVGPTWQVVEGLCIYGGPFLHLVDGDVDADAAGSYDGNGGTVVETLSADVEEDSQFGGYVGAQWDLTGLLDNAAWSAELQFTGDAWAFATGVMWKLP